MSWACDLDVDDLLRGVVHPGALGSLQHLDVEALERRLDVGLELLVYAHALSLDLGLVALEGPLGHTTGPDGGLHLLQLLGHIVELFPLDTGPDTLPRLVGPDAGDRHLGLGVPKRKRDSFRVRLATLLVEGLAHVETHLLGRRPQQVLGVVEDLGGAKARVRHNPQLAGGRELAGQDAHRRVSHVDLILAGKLLVGDLDAEILFHDLSLLPERQILPVQGSHRVSEAQWRRCGALQPWNASHNPERTATGSLAAVHGRHVSINDAVGDLVGRTPCHRVGRDT